MYAIIRAGGKQYRVEQGALLTVASLEGDPGQKVTLGEVLLLADGETITAGSPHVKGAAVTAEIVAHGKNDKIIVFKYKNKTRSRKRTGHRQKNTTIRITNIQA